MEAFKHVMKNKKNYSKAVQLIIFLKVGTGKEIEYEYSQGEKISWQQIKLRSVISLRL